VHDEGDARDKVEVGLFTPPALLPKVPPVVSVKHDGGVVLTRRRKKEEGKRRTYILTDISNGPRGTHIFSRPNTFCWLVFSIDYFKPL
jgi:hypothetical protein